MKKENKTILTDAAKVVESTAEAIDSVVDETEKQIEKTVAPVRKHVIKRFPIIFVLLVALGFSATTTGLEQMLLRVGFFQDNPVTLLIIGVGVLILTGTLYKKLG